MWTPTRRQMVNPKELRLRLLSVKLTETLFSLGLAAHDAEACPSVKLSFIFFYLAFLTEVKGKVFTVLLLNWWATEEPKPPGQLANAVKAPLFSVRIVRIP